MTRSEMECGRRLLCSLQDAIREAVTGARARSGRGFSGIARVTAADTIYNVDQVAEDAILDWFDRNWPREWPVEIVMEGLEGPSTTFPPGIAPRRTRVRCIIDPIDGTRCLMYDKRSAWALAALAPQNGARTNLADLVVAAMTELPIGNQGRADQLSAVRGGGRAGVIAHTLDLRTGRRRRFTPRPSPATDFRHGFASLVQFFPEGKALTARIEEELWRSLAGSDPAGTPVVFNDQYLSTGGQLHELLVGHDRMIGDLRPLVFAKLGLKSALTCHPYDICTALVLTESGGIVETPAGRPLSVPLDTTSPVAWMAYANPVLARTVRPVLRGLLRKFL